MRIDQEKLTEIRTHCYTVRGKKFLSKRSFQSLLGKLFHVHKCVKAARVFMNRMLDLFRRNVSKKNNRLTKEFYDDLDWFCNFLDVCNGVTILEKSLLFDSHEIFLDACLTGVGGIWRDRCYAAPFPAINGFSTKIVHLEMINLVVAFGDWGSIWAGKNEVINCDNAAVVHVTNTGKTRDLFLGACVRILWWICAYWDINLAVRHVSGIYNIIADSLSRLFSESPVNLSLIKNLKESLIWEHITPNHFSLTLYF